MRLGNYLYQVSRLLALARLSLTLKSGKIVDLAPKRNVSEKALAA
ncbi:MAG TPA: hypothetical protein VNO14_11700 [Blastocatellia bacterium]|jgi:hypothetical protein|nr:hypothetical protein [Blastocatellia bacterium]